MIVFDFNALLSALGKQFLVLRQSNFPNSGLNILSFI